MTWFPETGALSAVAGLVAGWGVPSMIRRIPEPVTQEERVDDADAGAAVGAEAPPQGEEPKEPYAAIAALPALGWRCAAASAIAAGLIGARLGWQWTLLTWLVLTPVGVGLAVVDWRTRLLPTRVIAPLYGVVGALCVVAALLSGDWGDLRRAGWGWVLGGGTFLLLWLVYPRGMGYGDVRLSGVLGIALGYLGWGQLVVGVYAGFLLGGVGGTLLTVLRIVDRRAYPFGPFMLLGALVGVLWGDWFASLYVA